MNEQPYKWMKLDNTSMLIEIKVIPNSSKNSISNEDGYLKIKLTAPPVDNKANTALIEFFAKLLKIPKSSIAIIKGQTSKNKKLSLPLNSKKCLESLITKE